QSDEPLAILALAGGDVAAFIRGRARTREVYSHSGIHRIARTGVRASDAQSGDKDYDELRPDTHQLGGLGYFRSATMATTLTLDQMKAFGRNHFELSRWRCLGLDPPGGAAGFVQTRGIAEQDFSADWRMPPVCWKSHSCTRSRSGISSLPAQIVFT